MTQTGGLLESGHVKAEAWSYLGGAGGTRYFTQSLETIYWGVLSHSPSGFPPRISKSGGEYLNYRAGSGKKHALGAKSPSLAALRAEATSCQHISTPQALGGRGHALPRGRVHALSSPPPPAGRRGQGAQPGQPQRLTIHLRTPGRRTRIFTHQSLPPPGM